jgi:hypothetical protein
MKNNGRNLVEIAQRLTNDKHEQYYFILKTALVKNKGNRNLFSLIKFNKRSIDKPCETNNREYGHVVFKERIINFEEGLGHLRDIDNGQFNIQNILSKAS